jgi:HNH endonuclease
MARPIVIRWDEAGIRGYLDVLPADLLRVGKHRAAVEHEVRGPRGGHYGLAKGKVAVRAKAVDIDYTSFAKLNDERGMELGILRLVFADHNRRVIDHIEWRNQGEKHFKPAEAAVIPTSALPSAQTIYEGAVKRINTRAFVRDPRLRRRCIAHYGTMCAVCRFNFEKTYGPVAAGFIHVHHVRALSKRGGRHKLDPVKELRPVCPNCHAVLHLDPSLSISRLKTIMSA